MKKFYLFIFLFFFLSVGIAQNGNDLVTKNAVIKSLDSKFDQYHQIAQQIWSFAELGYQEEQSSNLLQEMLIEAGFSIERGVAEIPTAFIATWGSGKPIIGILAEFDALPGLSQAASPVRDVLEERGAGHGCGHHLFGTGSSAAAIAVKEWIEKEDISGTIRLYGTPAEEGGGGKVYMVKAGLFEGVDIVLHWHPANHNAADAASSLANKSAKFRFYGKSAHAAAAPERGRSSLDGVEAMNIMANMMREHIQEDSRIHYVITRGGEAPNVIPDFAEVFYYCRHPDPKIVQQNFEWLVEIAEAGAKGTQTRVEYEVIHGLYNVLPNAVLGKIMHKNLELVGGVTYDPDEVDFAKKIQEYIDLKIPYQEAGTIKEFEIIEEGNGGSTDVGDVSWIVPTAGMRAATWVPGTPAHSWQAVACGGTSIGSKGMMVAAKTITLSAIELFTNPGLIEEAWQELDKRRGENFQYHSLVGDRKPPLDYRN